MNLWGYAEKNTNIHDFLAINLGKVCLSILPVYQVNVIEKRKVANGLVSKVNGLKPICCCSYLMESDNEKCAFHVNNLKGAQETLLARYSQLSYIFFWQVIFHEIRHAVQHKLFKLKTKYMFKQKRLDIDPTLQETYAIYKNYSWYQRVLESDAIYISYLCLLAMMQTLNENSFDFDLVKKILLTPKGEQFSSLEIKRLQIANPALIQNLNFDFVTSEQVKLHIFTIDS